MKVMLANLTELAQRIKDARSPYEAKRLGGSIKIFNWDNLGEGIVKTAMRYKFRQNPHLRKILLDTGSKNILECTPDMGAAIAMDSKLFGTGKHPGQNLTGHSLQELRVEFRDEESLKEVIPPPPTHTSTDQMPAQSTGKATGAAGSDLTAPPT